MSFQEKQDDALQPFLHQDSSDDSTISKADLDVQRCSCHRKNRRRRFAQGNHLTLAAGFLVVLLVNAALSLWLTRTVSCDSKARPQLISSPLAPLIETERKWLGSPFLNNSFVGEPGPVVDEAWATLLRNAQIKITPEEVAQTDHHTSVALADGSGYVAELGVYHWLHCLKMVKQYIHLDHYHPEYTEHEKERQKLHISHCIEFLREALMCKADVSVMTFYWAEGFEKPASARWSSHECVNWETVENWAGERRLDLSQPGLLAPRPEPSTT